MGSRYSHEGMGNIWSDQAYWNFALRVELAVVGAKRKLGLIDVSSGDFDAAYSVGIDSAEIDRIEAEETRHDVKAFLQHVNPRLAKSIQPFFHGGMTSYDLVDTVRGLQMTKSIRLVMDLLDNLMHVLGARAKEFKNAVQMGRTHGVDAECITFGVKLARFYDEANRHMRRLEQALERIEVGKISGAVGMHTLDPKIEELALDHLGLKAVLSTQIIPRDIFAEYVHTLVLAGNFVANIAYQIRLLVQTSIGEVQEFFRKKQTGSSAMPHKRNPISAENLYGQAKVLRALTAIAYENQLTWHERSLDNSSAERELLPLVSHKVAYMLQRMTRLLNKLLVYPERMEKNIWLTKGLIFSQNVMLLVAGKNEMPREDAHKLVKDIAQQCYDDGTDFYKELKANARVMELVNESELMACFDINTHLKHVDHIFKRAFRDAA
jgi:adenylosuccinate lyase